MSYIELHEHVWNHPKTIELSGRLQIRKTYAVAHLSRLWTWCIRYAENGCITDISPFILADAADWGGDPELFLRALIDSKFVDQHPDGMFIHDWEDYAGKLIDFRKKDRERKKKSSGARQHSNGNPMEIQRKSDGEKVDSSSITYNLKPIPNTQYPIPNTQEGGDPPNPPRKRKPSASASARVDGTYSDDPRFNSCLQEFIRMRNANKKPLTEHALDLVKKELERLAPGDLDKQIAIIDQSIKKAWLDVYPLKDNHQPRQGMAVFDEAERILRERGSLP